MGLITLFLAVSGVAVALSAGQVNGGGSTQDGAVHLDVESGGRTAVKDVKTNKRIQAMGRYCVSEYNKGLKQKNLEGMELLKFKEVAKAEQQVVAGVKYFLHIAATTHGGTVKSFDAEVLLKPRARDMEMLVFAPDMVTINILKHPVVLTEMGASKDAGELLMTSIDSVAGCMEKLGSVKVEDQYVKISCKQVEVYSVAADSILTHLKYNMKGK